MRGFGCWTPLKTLDQMFSVAQERRDEKKMKNIKLQADLFNFVWQSFQHFNLKSSSDERLTILI